MKYNNTVEAEFISRPNRFIAQVLLNGEQETVHVKNTGRCRELLLPGSRVILCEGVNPERKTKYDLIAVYKENLGWVNIDSQIPNAVVREWLESGGIPGFTEIRPEYGYGNSRVDFYARRGNEELLIEVKGCTLEIDGKGFFPDAPTVRGVKHLRELTDAVKKGFTCYVVFVIAMPKVRDVYPNGITDPDFEKAYNEAIQAGVKIINLQCRVTKDSITAVPER